MRILNVLCQLFILMDLRQGLECDVVTSFVYYSFQELPSPFQDGEGVSLSFEAPILGNADKSDLSIFNM